MSTSTDLAERVMWCQRCQGMTPHVEAHASDTDSLGPAITLTYCQRCGVWH